MSKKSATYGPSWAEMLFESISDYAQLIKFRLTTMVVLTAVASFFLSAGAGTFSWTNLLLLSIGGVGIAGASNILNQVLEKDFDALMTRTQNRPVAAGRMSSSHAVMCAGFMCLIGVTALSYFNNLAAFFGMLALVLYSFVYTPLKRYSSVAILVGAMAGAMPMLIGSVAAMSELTSIGIFLFLIQLAWQFPHFWSIGLLSFEDYQKADYHFIPTTINGQASRYIGISSIMHCTALCVIGIIAYKYDLIGLIGFAGTTILSGVYLYYSIGFYRLFTRRAAKSLMFMSLVYIPGIIVVLFIDQSILI